jgi:hypothetical protein
MFSMVDRLERLHLNGAQQLVGHRYTVVCEKCGAESAPFFLLPAGDAEGTVTGVLGQSIAMGEKEIERECTG